MKNKINLVLVLAIFSVLSVMSVNATISLVSPANSATVSGTYILNATNVTTTFDQIANCTFYAKSSLTANSSWTSLGTFNNDSLISVNGTFDSTILEDANNYIFNATCRNSSNSVQSIASTATIIVDNTDPTTPSALSPTSDTDGTVSFSATVTGRETTSCTLYFSGINPGNPSYAMTHSGDTCTYTDLSMPEQTYQYYVRASDETNTTDSATTTLDVDVHTSAGAGTVAQQQATTEQIIAQEQAEQQRNTILIIIGVIVGLVVLYIIVSRWNKFS